MSAMMHVDVGEGRMSVKGDVHWADHALFEKSLDEMRRSAAKKLVMDFSEATFVFSSVVASLLTAAAEIEASGKTLHMVIPPSLDWLKRYLKQNAPARRFPGITLEDA